MGRTASGRDVLAHATACLAQAKTVEALRQAQAVVLPLEFGLTLPQTAQAIGVSVGWACRLRTRFVREGEPHAPSRAVCGGRRRQNMRCEEEAAWLAPFLETAKVGGVLVVGAITRALDERLGRPVALASAYNLLHRHGWRKLAPDTRHPKTDVAAQDDWKKNSPIRSKQSSGSGLRRARSG